MIKGTIKNIVLHLVFIVAIFDIPAKIQNFRKFGIILVPMIPDFLSYAV